MPCGDGGNSMDMQSPMVGGNMKGRIFRKTAQVYRSRDPGPRELQRRHMENLYAKADVGSKKPRPPEAPQSTKERR